MCSLVLQNFSSTLVFFVMWEIYMKALTIQSDEFCVGFAIEYYENYKVFALFME
jgi:hypothetical protein